VRAIDDHENTACLAEFNKSLGLIGCRLTRKNPAILSALPGRTLMGMTKAKLLGTWSNMATVAAAGKLAATASRICLGVGPRKNSY
jgi:hypothetical protein